MKIKKILIYISCFCIFIVLILNTNICIVAAKEGLNLWINVVFPSLFPFFIASSLLISCGAASAFGYILSPIMRIMFKASGESGYIMATSMLSGYPMGARLCAQMHTQGYINTDQVEHFLSFVNTSGPSFIIGAVATGMLKNAQLGIYIAFSHYLASILTGILFSVKRNRINPGKNIPAPPDTPPIGQMISEAVNGAMQTQLVIGGFIILFSIIINLLLKLNILGSIASAFTFLGMKDTQLLTGALAGVFEITNSCNILAKGDADLNMLLPILSAVISFSGLSILMQSYTLLSQTGIRFKALLFPKIIHASLSFILCHVSIILFPISVESSNIVFPYGSSFIDILVNCSSYSIIYALLILIITLVFNINLYSKKPV